MKTCDGYDIITSTTTRYTVIAFPYGYLTGCAYGRKEYKTEHGAETAAEKALKSGKYYTVRIYRHDIDLRTDNAEISESGLYKELTA